MKWSIGLILVLPYLDRSLEVKGSTNDGGRQVRDRGARGEETAVAGCLELPQGRRGGSVAGADAPGEGPAPRRGGGPRWLPASEPRP